MLSKLDHESVILLPFGKRWSIFLNSSNPHLHLAFSKQITHGKKIPNLLIALT